MREALKSLTGLYVIVEVAVATSSSTVPESRKFIDEKLTA
jgi:hypothetical protein